MTDHRRHARFLPRGRPGGWRATRAVALLALLGLLLAVVPGAAAPVPAGAAGAAGAAGPALPPDPPPPPVAWHACPATPGYRCGTVPVPVDYRHPHGATIDLAVIEKPATDPAASRGVLLFNPGGPGESGVQILPVLASLVPPAVARDFDLVSFDERGTGASDDLACGPSPAAAASVDPLPAAAGQPLPATALYRGLAASCRGSDPALLAHVDSTDAARDMDRIRQALGVRQVSYWGLSYGTVLGSVYAHLYPGHVRAMVLDGAVEATEPLATQAGAEAPAIAASLDHFFATCGGRSPCPLGSDPRAAFDRLAASLRRQPLPAPGDGDLPVTVGDLYTATLFYLSVPGVGGTFITALVAAEGGDGAGLRTLSLTFEQDLDGASLVGPEWAYTCNDAGGHPGPRAAGRLARSLAARYGLAGAEAVTYDLGGCLDWPPASSQPVTALHVDGGPRIVVIGNTGDPNTPHGAAVQLARSLGTGTLVTWRGWGHTWLLNGSTDPCMRRVVDAYLVDRRPPPPGTTCT